MSPSLSIRTSKQIARLLSGAYRSVFHGSGIEFREFREYLSGDDARQIDWRASSKSDKVFVRRYEEERSIEVLFIIDVGVHMQFGSGGTSKSVFTAELLRLLLDAITDGGDRFGAYFFTDRVVERIPSARGDQSSQIVLERYRHNLTSGPKTVSNVFSMMDYLLTTQVRRRLIFIVSDDYERFSTGVPDSLRTLAMSNDVVCFFPFDWLERTLSSSLFLRVANQDWSQILLWRHDSSQFTRFDRETSQIRDMLRETSIDSLFLDISTDPFSDLIGFFRQHTSLLSRS